MVSSLTLCFRGRCYFDTPSKQRSKPITNQIIQFQFQIQIQFSGFALTLNITSIHVMEPNLFAAHADFRLLNLKNHVEKNEIF